jgi:hypothetical protein
MFSSYFESNSPYYYLYSIRDVNSKNYNPFFILKTSEHQIYFTMPEVYAYLSQNNLLNDFKEKFDVHSRYQMEDFKKQTNLDVFFAGSAPIVLNKFSYLHIQSKPNNFYISTKPFHYEDSPIQKIELNGIFQEPSLFEHFSILGLFLESFHAGINSYNVKKTTSIIKFIEVVSPLYPKFKDSILFFLNYRVTHHNSIKEIRSLLLEQLYEPNAIPNVPLILKDFEIKLDL